MKEILVNRIKCGYCKEIIQSKHVHDFVRCECEKTTTDGGSYYLHVSGDNWEDMSIYDDAPYEEIRKHLCRGGRGKDGKQPLKYVSLADMSDGWLENVIEYETENRPNNKYIKWYKKELEYREDNNIKIEEQK